MNAAVKTVPLDKLFELTGQKPAAAIPLEVRTEPSPFVPAKQDNYLFDKDSLQTMLLWRDGDVCNNLYIGGPAGCGKSSLAEQFAARMGLPVFRMGCHRAVRMEDLRGQMVIKVVNGHQVTEFQYGPLVLAMQAGGILLLDEGDTLDPSCALSLNTILDGAPLLVPETGELIVAHPDFRVVMTGNTLGAGDDTGQYRGTTRQNLAVMDRFLVLEADYLQAMDEARIIHRMAPTLPGIMLDRMLQVATMIRGAFLGKPSDQGDFQRCEIPLSTRGLLRWAKLAEAYLFDGHIEEMALVRTMKVAFLSRASATDAQFALSCSQHTGLISAETLDKLN